jgi:hypothetical protein
MQRIRELSPMANTRADQPEPTVDASGGLRGAQAADRAVPTEASQPMAMSGRVLLKA